MIELLVVLVVMAEVIVAVLTLFDFNTRLTQVQGRIADMQQSLRIAQYDTLRLVRMAGRGGLRGVPLPQSQAVSVRNKTANNTTNVALAYAGTGASKSLVVKDTDVLTVRGVFSTAIYQVQTTSTAAYVLAPTTDPTTATSGTVQICSSITGVAQDLALWRTYITQAAAGKIVNEALILTSPASDFIYGVVRFDPSTSLATSNACSSTDPTQGVTIAFTTGVAGGTARADLYRGLSSATGAQRLPSGLTSVLSVGILEEYRYYIRQEYAVPGDATTTLTPRLARARLYPNTELPYADDSQNLRVDIADNITDLQIALGIDKNGNGVIDENANLTADEWLFNDTGDDANPATGGWGAAAAKLLYVRLDTLASTDRPDPRFRAPLVARIEDRVYAAGDTANTTIGRMHRRRLLQTMAMMRNL